MDDFQCEIRKRVSEALKDMGAEGTDFVVEASTMEGVDMAVPCFPMAKALRKAPQAIADELATRIQPSGIIAKVSSVNGFLNFNIDTTTLVKLTLDEIVNNGAQFSYMPKTGVRVNVEHTSTNPTGPIHVGRARNPIIGDTLARCLKRCGHDVMTEYYVNDVGKQVVVLTWGVNNVTDEEAAKNSEEHMKEIGQNEKERDKTDHRLVAKYRVANKRMEAEPEVQEEISEMMRRFEQGDQQVIDTVRHTAGIMLDGLKETLGNINVVLDRYTWESQYIADGSARAVVEKLKKSEYAGQTDDGAWYVDLKDFGVQGKNTKFTFTRSDGTTLLIALSENGLCQVPELLQEAMAAVNTIGVPGLGLFHGAQKHLIKTKRVGTELLHNHIGIHHVEH